jgi:hypothetical protein
MLPSPRKRWMLNTALANAVPSDFRIGDTYDAEPMSATPGAGQPPKAPPTP